MDLCQSRAGRANGWRPTDHLALAEAYLHGRIDLEGDLAEVLKVTDVLALDESRWDRARVALGLLLRGRRAMNRDAVGA